MDGSMGDATSRAARKAKWRRRGRRVASLFSSASAAALFSRKGAQSPVDGDTISSATRNSEEKHGRAKAHGGVDECRRSDRLRNSVASTIEKAREVLCGSECPKSKSKQGLEFHVKKEPMDEVEKRKFAEISMEFGWPVLEHTDASQPKEGEAERDESSVIMAEIIGSGANAEIHNAQFGANRVVMKVCVKKSNSRMEHWKVEADTINALSLSFPRYFPKFYGVCVVDGCPAVVMDFCEGRDLSRLLKMKKFDVMRRLVTAREVVRAIGLMHDNGFLHRDVKPPNIMVNVTAETVEVKLIDLAFSERMETRKVDSRRGTPNYLAPEIPSGRGACCGTDAFAIGAVLCDLFDGKGHLGGFILGGTLQEKLRHVIAGYRRDVATVPLVLQPLVIRCLHPDPFMRPTMREIDEELAVILPKSITPPQKRPETVGSPLYVKEFGFWKINTTLLDDTVCSQVKRWEDETAGNRRVSSRSTAIPDMSIRLSSSKTSVDTGNFSTDGMKGTALSGISVDTTKLPSVASNCPELASDFDELICDAVERSMKAKVMML